MTSHEHDAQRLCDQPAQQDAETYDEIVLVQLSAITAQIEHLMSCRRKLIAYARHLVVPRPYTLASLAEASGMSISGVRTAYTDQDIAVVVDLLASPREQS